MASEENRPVTPSSEEPEETVVQDAEHSAGEAAVQEAAAEIAEDSAELTEDTAETAETVEEAAEETENEETAAEAPEEPNAEAPEEPNAEASEEPETAPAETPKKGLSKGARISIIIAAAVLVLGALAAGVFWFLSAHPELTAKKVETAYGDRAYLAENTAFGTSALTDRDRYDITDTTADSLEMRTAIARDENGDYFMTNGELQVAYWMEFYQMMQNYGSYISMMGLDTTRPLHEQSSLLEGNTWEQYFLTSVVKKTSQFRALERAAQADGYELPEDVATQLDDLTNPEGDLAKEAADAGFESIDAYLQENFGAGVTAKDYQNYMRMYITAMHYYQDVLYGEPYANATDAEVEAYYDANAEAYAEKGTLKVNNVNIRRKARRARTAPIPRMHGQRRRPKPTASMPCGRKTRRRTISPSWPRPIPRTATQATAASMRLLRPARQSRSSTTGALTQTARPAIPASCARPTATTSCTSAARPTPARGLTPRRRIWPQSLPTRRSMSSAKPMWKNLTTPICGSLIL